MRDPKKRAERFRRTREDHALETASDYCELIEELILETGEARSVDMAQRLGISPVTVSATVKRLARDGYATAERYRSIFLTDKGKELARAAREKHDLVLRFLIALGVPKDLAEKDAEGIEHHVSEATLDAFDRFLSG